MPDVTAEEVGLVRQAVARRFAADDALELLQMLGIAPPNAPATGPDRGGVEWRRLCRQCGVPITTPVTLWCSLPAGFRRAANGGSCTDCYRPGNPAECAGGYGRTVASKDAIKRGLHPGAVRNQAYRHCPGCWDRLSPDQRREVRLGARRCSRADANHDAAVA